MTSPQLFVGEFNGAVWLVPTRVPSEDGFDPNYNPYVSLVPGNGQTWTSLTKVDSVGIGAGTFKTTGNVFSVTVDQANGSAQVVTRVPDPFDATKRAAVYSAFAEFRAGVDGLETGTSPALAPGAARLLLQKLVDLFPVLLAPQTTEGGLLYEPLFFRYGLNPRQVDLQPGMRLRVDQAPHQFVPPAQAVVNGNAGSGTSHYVVSARSSDRRLTFDNFLSAAGPLTVDRSNPAFVSGVVDLENAADARRLYRLFYPSSISSSYQQPTSVAGNVTLAGADSVAELNSAYPTPAAASKVVYSFFRGRATVVPEVQVFVNGSPLYIPLGTTVRQVVEANTNWGIAEMQLANADQESGAHQSLFVSRYWGPGMQAGYGANLGPANIQFGPRPQATAIDPASAPVDPPAAASALFDLPLIQGDMISWAVPTSPALPSGTSK